MTGGGAGLAGGGREYGNGGGRATTRVAPTGRGWPTTSPARDWRTRGGQPQGLPLQVGGGQRPRLRGIGGREGGQPQGLPLQVGGGQRPRLRGIGGREGGQPQGLPLQVGGGQRPRLRGIGGRGGQPQGLPLQVGGGQRPRLRGIGGREGGQPQGLPLQVGGGQRPRLRGIGGRGGQPQGLPLQIGGGQRPRLRGIGGRGRAITGRGNPCGCPDGQGTDSGLWRAASNWEGDGGLAVGYPVILPKGRVGHDVRRPPLDLHEYAADVLASYPDMGGIILARPS